VSLIKNSDLGHEFRNVIVLLFDSSDNVKSIILQPSESKQLVVQEIIPEHAMNKKLNSDDSFFGH
jgi:hypothetical protein